MSLVSCKEKRVLHRQDVQPFDEGLNFQNFILANLPSMDEIPNSEVKLVVKLEMTVLILFHFVGFISSFENVKLTSLLHFTTDCS